MLKSDLGSQAAFNTIKVNAVMLVASVASEKVGHNKKQCFYKSNAPFTHDNSQAPFGWDDFFARKQPPI